MITRYLSGKATPDEEAAVLAYLSESEEHLDDFLAMSAAIEINNEVSHQKHVRPLWPVISAVASVALLIGLGITLWHNHMIGENIGIDPAPTFAVLDSIDKEEAL